MNLRTAALCLGLLCTFAEVSFAEPGTAVKVGVVAEHTGSKITYSYRVINNSAQTISAITIGRNPANDGDELTERPSGWNSRIGIPPSSSNSPTGWKISMSTPQENQSYALEWEATNNTAGLESGQSQNKMDITLDKADSRYLNGHVQITFADGNPTTINVPIERFDTTAPTLTVSLSPNTLTAGSNKFVAINATFPVKNDNIDHLPQIKLESITANPPLNADDIRDASDGLDDRYFRLRAEPQGRIYKVIYSATDASGNKTTASALVTVGNNQDDINNPKAN